MGRARAIGRRRVAGAGVGAAAAASNDVSPLPKLSRRSVERQLATRSSSSEPSPGRRTGCGGCGSGGSWAAALFGTDDGTGGGVPRRYCCGDRVRPSDDARGRRCLRCTAQPSSLTSSWSEPEKDGDSSASLGSSASLASEASEASCDERRRGDGAGSVSRRHEARRCAGGAE